MKFTASSALLAGATLLSAMSAVSAQNLAQFSAKPLVVKPGGIVTVTMNFVVTDPITRRLGDGMGYIQAGLSTDENFSGWCDFGFGASSLTFKNSSKNHTGKADRHADDVGITIRSAKIFPNTWKPKAKANITELDDGELGVFLLEEDEAVENKEYKITYKVRVGKGVDSGDIITIPIALEGPNFGFTEEVEVLVK